MNYLVIMMHRPESENVRIEVAYVDDFEEVVECTREFYAEHSCSSPQHEVYAILEDGVTAEQHRNLANILADDVLAREKANARMDLMEAQDAILWAKEKLAYAESEYARLKKLVEE